MKGATNVSRGTLEMRIGEVAPTSRLPSFATAVAAFVGCWRPSSGMAGFMARGTMR
jgi:hypothetical protein